MGLFDWDNYKRVLSITHKPSEVEFKQMAFSVLIGLAIIGGIGFVISMAVRYMTGTGL